MMTAPTTAEARLTSSEPADTADLLRQAHLAHDEHRFGDACDGFAQADDLASLSAADIVAWGDAAWWLGRTDRALELAERGHRRLVQDGQRVRAATEAIGLGFLLMLRGDLAPGSGWMQRGRSLLEEEPDEAARGLLLQLDAYAALHEDELDLALDLSRRAGEIAIRVSDSTLRARALMTQGRIRLRTGAVTEALALLDEAMLPVLAGEVAPADAGNLYCDMISICWELWDLRRAREWTAATERWCEDFDSAMMFSGICRMHRVQLRQVGGDWDTALEEARVVCTELADMNRAVVAEGHYLLGDLRRLRGDDEEAEAAYRRAHALGRQPQPGLALLRAQQGRSAAALTSLQTMLASLRGAGYQRAPLLRGVVDVAITAHDHAAAGAAANELDDLAGRWSSEGLVAAALHARGALTLAQGAAQDAVSVLREASRCWQGLDAPHDRACAQLLLATALTRLGDEDAARLEYDAAATTFRELGAVVDLRRLERLRPSDEPPGGLTPREAEVLVQVADGSTNRQVAARLVLSEKTVARHLANAYLKLGVSTRTAAAAWARDHGLVPTAPDDAGHRR